MTLQESSLQVCSIGDLHKEGLELVEGSLLFGHSMCDAYAAESPLDGILIPDFNSVSVAL